LSEVELQVKRLPSAEAFLGPLNFADMRADCDNLR